MKPCPFCKGRKMQRAYPSPMDRRGIIRIVRCWFCR